MMITANGCYEIAIERYHHDPKLCDAPSISSAGLKQVAKCPAKYFAFSPYNPKRLTPKTSKAFDIGKAAHSLVLGEPEFNAHFIISPFDDFRKKEAQEWRDAQTLTILKAEEFSVVLAMCEAQRANPDVMNAFVNGRAEMSLIFKDVETGIYLRSRPDWLPDDLTTHFPVDYKSSVDIEPRKISGDAFKFGYVAQAALQIDAVDAVFGIRPQTVGHVVQEKEAPYIAEVKLFTPEQLEYGQVIYRKALRRFADCLTSGKWPSYSIGPSYYDTPRWVEAQMEDMTDVDDGYAAQTGYSPAEYYAAL